MPKPVATGHQRERLASMARGMHKQGRKQTAIARDLGVSQPTVSKLINTGQKKRQSKK